mgnify:CR=1 FL=1
MSYLFQFFGQGVNSVTAEKLRGHECTDRPLGSDKFVMKLENILDRILRPAKAGRPKKETAKKKREN